VEKLDDLIRLLKEGRLTPELLRHEWVKREKVTLASRKRGRPVGILSQGRKDTLAEIYVAVVLEHTRQCSLKPGVSRASIKNVCVELAGHVTPGHLADRFKEAKKLRDQGDHEFLCCVLIVNLVVIVEFAAAEMPVGKRLGYYTELAQKILTALESMDGAMPPIAQEHFNKLKLDYNFYNKMNPQEKIE
jgi:hypothetical protein